jgi:hypothetical protein
MPSFSALIQYWTGKTTVDAGANVIPLVVGDPTVNLLEETM